MFVAPFLSGVVLVEAAQIPIVAFIQGRVPADWQIRLPEFVEHQLHRFFGARENGGKASVEGKAHGLEAPAGGLGFGDALFGQVGISPAGEKVFQIPLALAVTDEDKKAF